MNSRERFLETIRYGAPDRVPYFEEGIRSDVIRVWRRQGLKSKPVLEEMFRIPAIFDRGFNCLWAYEADSHTMDCRGLRQEFSRNLRLIGGIDLDVLRQGKDAIRFEVGAKVPPLLSEGGYIPMLDGRVRADIPFENYVYYKRLLEKTTGAGSI